MHGQPSARKTPTAEDLSRQNIETIQRIEQAFHEKRRRSEVISDVIASFCGSVYFIWAHCIWFGAWLILNMGSILPKSLRFDPPPYQVLTLIVSLEAIFLSTFILISQNREQRAAERRNHLDLQINLLAEQESSQLLGMMQKVLDHLQIPSDEAHHEALQEATDPEKLIEQIEEVQNAVEENL